MKRVTFNVDPWMRCHVDEIVVGMPATMLKGSITAMEKANPPIKHAMTELEMAGYVERMRRFDYQSVAIFARPATVTAFFVEDGLCKELILRDEITDTTKAFKVKMLGDQGTFNDRPISYDGWYCVVGERYASEE